MMPAVSWNGSLLKTESSAIELLKRYYDKSFSLTDATSFIVMERLGIKTAIAFDQHFAQYGFNLPQ